MYPHDYETVEYKVTQCIFPRHDTQDEQSFWSFAAKNKKTSKNEIVDNLNSSLLYRCIV